MEVKIKHFITAIVTSLVAIFVFTLPAYAGGTYYVNADNGDDANGCVSASAACKTIGAARAKIIALADASNITLKLAGTFNESVKFYASDVTAPNSLDGLRITATNSDVKPLIDATGFARGIDIFEVHDVTIDYLKVANASEIGILVSGDNNNLVNGVSVHDNQVYDIASTDDDVNAVYGVEINQAKAVSILNNTISGISVNLTNGTSYDYLNGLAVVSSSNVTIRNNTISDITNTNSISADSTIHSSITYAIYLYNNSASDVSNNTINTITTTQTTDLNNVALYSYAYGIDLLGGYDVVVRDNSVSAVTSVTTGSADSNYSRGYAYGMYITEIQRHAAGNSLIRGNTFSDIATNSTGDNVSNDVYGISINAVHALSVRNNTIDNLDVTQSSSAVYGSVTGTIYGLSVSSNTAGAIKNNTISDLDSTSSYSGEGSTSTGAIYGLHLNTLFNYTVQNNSLRDYTAVVNNNNVTDYYDAPRIYGMYIYSGSDLIIKKNSLQNHTVQYETSGQAGLSYSYQYGIYSYRAQNLTVQKNTYKNSLTSLTSNDPTDNGYVYGYVYPIYLTDGKSSIVKGNIIQSVTTETATTLDNYVGMSVYGIELLDSPNSTISNNKIKGVTQTGSADTSSGASLYGIYVDQSPDTLISDNTVRGNTLTFTGSSSAANFYGIYVSNTRPVYVNGNLVRNNIVSAESIKKHYGIYFSNDASRAYVFNNIVLGRADNESDNDYGMYLNGESTNKFWALNNTLANVVKPLSIQGGSKLRFKNNIMVAKGTNSYALEVAANKVDFDTLQSNYNLLYNKTTKSQKVFDSDNDTAIILSSWKSNKGSYSGQDRKAVTKSPKLKSNGLLKKGSKAIDKGTKQYGFSKKSLAYQLLQADYNGTMRPQGKKVDIGADEHKK